MASRKDQKAQAREQRLAQEREAAESAQRKQRLQIVAGIAAIAVVVVVVIIVVASSGTKAVNTDPTSKTNVKASKQVNDMLDGIPQPAGQDITIGNPNAKVTITEFGDLECSACDELDIPRGWQSPDAASENFEGSGTLDQVITNLVKTGKAKLEYRSLETATGNDKTPGMWTTQQAAANAAALQGKGWNFVEIFYSEQGPEADKYVDDSYIENIAKQVKGLNYAQWLKDWKTNKAATNKVKSDNTAGIQLDSTNTATGDQVATPTVWVKGPKSQHIFVGEATYSAIEAVVNANL